MRETIVRLERAKRFGLIPTGASTIRRFATGSELAPQTWATEFGVNAAGNTKEEAG